MIGIVSFIFHSIVVEHVVQIVDNIDFTEPLYVEFAIMQHVNVVNVHHNTMRKTRSMFDSSLSCDAMLYLFLQALRLSLSNLSCVHFE